MGEGRGELLAVAADQNGKTPRIVTETEGLPVQLLDSRGNIISDVVSS